MPMYDYLCNACGETFTRLVSIRDNAAGKVNCPKCNSADVKQQMTSFVAKTTRKRWGDQHIA
jgi:putative FmdB family regulatory protein